MTPRQLKQRREQREWQEYLSKQRIKEVEYHHERAKMEGDLINIEVRLQAMRLGASILSRRVW